MALDDQWLDEHDALAEIGREDDPAAWDALAVVRIELAEHGRATRAQQRDA